MDVLPLWEESLMTIVSVGVHGLEERVHDA